MPTPNDANRDVIPIGSAVQRQMAGGKLATLSLGTALKRPPCGALLPSIALAPFLLACFGRLGRDGYVLLWGKAARRIRSIP